jgi:hypothetical protein
MNIPAQRLGTATMPAYKRSISGRGSAAAPATSAAIAVPVANDKCRSARAIVFSQEPPSRQHHVRVPMRHVVPPSAAPTTPHQMATTATHPKDVVGMSLAKASGLMPTPTAA